MHPIIQKTHLQSASFSLDNPTYKNWVHQYTFDDLKKDLGEKGDITTSLLFAPDVRGSANIVIKQKGILAGMQEAKYFLNAFPISCNFLKKDGDEAAAADIVLKLSGKISDLMKVERVLLNLLGRMSGVATKTNRLVKLAREVNPNILLTPTRKTLWGWLDKRACVLGGGGTHRLSLEDAILIKHNHVRAFGKNPRELLQKIISQKPSAKFIEIEVNRKEDAFLAAQFFLEAKRKGFPLACFVMLDNVPIDEVFRVMFQLKANRLPDGIFFEASGGIHDHNFLSYVKTGVDIVSLGILTHGAPMLDVSLRMI